MQHAYLLEYASVLRLMGFVLVLSILIWAERSWPKRPVEKQNRYMNNFMLLGLDILVIRLLVLLAGYEMATVVAIQEFGLLSHISMPLGLEIILVIIIFDLFIYIQHILFHRIPILWRIHRVHHSDLGFDVSTGVRFHPLEIILSMFYKLAVIYLIGPSAIAFLCYEIVLNGASLFTHSNIKLAPHHDRYLRHLIVTPNMHRTHHLASVDNTESNYGNLLSIWDKCFQTQRHSPDTELLTMQIGIAEIRKPLSISEILRLPFNMVQKEGSK